MPPSSFRPSFATRTRTSSAEPDAERRRSVTARVAALAPDPARPVPGVVVELREAVVLARYEDAAASGLERRLHGALPEPPPPDPPDADPRRPGGAWRWLSQTLDQGVKLSTVESALLAMAARGEPHGVELSGTLMATGIGDLHAVHAELSHAGEAAVHYLRDVVAHTDYLDHAWDVLQEQALPTLVDTVKGLLHISAEADVSLGGLVSRALHDQALGVGKTLFEEFLHHPLGEDMTAHLDLAAQHGLDALEHMGTGVLHAITDSGIPFFGLLFSSAREFRKVRRGEIDMWLAAQHVVEDTASAAIGAHAGMIVGAALGLSGVGLFVAPVVGAAAGRFVMHWIRGLVEDDPGTGLPALAAAYDEALGAHQKAVEHSLRTRIDEARASYSAGSEPVPRLDASAVRARVHTAVERQLAHVTGVLGEARSYTEDADDAVFRVKVEQLRVQARRCRDDLARSHRMALAGDHLTALTVLLDNVPPATDEGVENGAHPEDARYRAALLAEATELQRLRHEHREAVTRWMTRGAAGQREVMLALEQHHKRDTEDTEDALRQAGDALGEALKALPPPSRPDEEPPRPGEGPGGTKGHR
ncbi:nuclear hormone receptor family protein [Streptomyces antibioticus]|uniref:hypothetical protein n=1 Tax=Streptomyces antibioticus TaxID=1890 RepID=UPI0036F86235